jgi:menaquinone-dependent protoporphyrinogen oxidase
LNVKILILYATKNGATRECAEMLAGKLERRHEVTVVSARDADTLPSPTDFDVAVIGSSVRMGGINKKIKKYIKANADALSEMHTAVFLCCGNADNFDEYVALSLPKKLKFSLGAHYFGGELKPEKLHGLDKLIVKMVRSSIHDKNFENSSLDQIALPELLPENIERLSDAIRDIMAK